MSRLDEIRARRDALLHPPKGATLDDAIEDAIDNAPADIGYLLEEVALLMIERDQHHSDAADWKAVAVSRKADLAKSVAQIEVLKEILKEYGLITGAKEAGE